MTITTTHTPTPLQHYHTASRIIRHFTIIIVPFCMHFFVLYHLRVLLSRASAKRNWCTFRTGALTALIRHAAKLRMSPFPLEAVRATKDD